MDVVAFVSSWDHYSYKNRDQKDYADSEVYNTDFACIGQLPMQAIPPALPSEQQAVTGDVNGDGKLGVADLSSLIGLILNKSNNSAADLDKDGKVTLADLRLLISHILGETEPSR